MCFYVHYDGCICTEHVDFISCYCSLNHTVHSIYMESGIVDNLEMISNIQKDVHRLYVNTAAFYIRDLSMYRFWYPREILEPIRSA